MLSPDRARIIGRIGAAVTHSRYDSKSLTENARQTSWREALSASSIPRANSTRPSARAACPVRQERSFPAHDPQTP